jgi:hypothetical protein
MEKRSKIILKIAKKQIKLKQLPEWRYGQRIFNIAYDEFPEEANRLRSTSVDCFYQDNLVPEFLELIDKL